MNHTLIKAIISTKGLSQKSIADAIGISEKTIGNYLAGKSNLNSEDFCKMLFHLGFDLESELRSALAVFSSSKSTKKTIREQLMEEQRLKLNKWFANEIHRRTV
ncbi:MAG: helix-turn-helix domain-containing protein [Parachlamydiaceae bacterium]